MPVIHSCVRTCATPACPRPLSNVVEARSNFQNHFPSPGHKTTLYGGRGVANIAVFVKFFFGGVGSDDICGDDSADDLLCS